MNIVTPIDSTGYNIPSRIKGDAYKHIPRALNVAMPKISTFNLLDFSSSWTKRRINAFPYVSLSTRPSASGVSHSSARRGLPPDIGKEQVQWPLCWYRKGHRSTDAAARNLTGIEQALCSFRPLCGSKVHKLCELTKNKAQNYKKIKN